MEESHQQLRRLPASGALLILAVLLLACLAMARAAINVKDSFAVSRFITPNNDHRNDTFIFQCYNPRDSSIKAAIYNLAGTEVAQMRLKTIHNDGSYYYDMEWDPNSGDKKPGGVYFYQVVREGTVYKGAVVVIR